MKVAYRLFVVSLLLAVMAAPVSAQQGTGVITGRATDNSAAVMPGVTVTLTSPAVMGTRDAVTDERGAYRFDLLPLGTYTLKFELPGFATLIREGIQITGGFTATINVALQVASLAETVTVTGQSPVVDLQSATLAVNLLPEMLANVPTGRDFFGTLGLSPGIMMKTFDIGGSGVGTYASFRTYGTDSQDFALIDGVITVNYFGDIGSVQEMQVIAASKGADVANAGSYVNAIIKTGSNDLHWKAEAYLETPKFQGSNLNDRLRGFGLTQTSRISRFTDFNAEAGGPIRKDKTWWYFSARDAYSAIQSLGFKKGGCLIVFDGCRSAPIGTFAAAEDNSANNENAIHWIELPNATLKLNHQFNLNNQLSYMGNWDEKLAPFIGGSGPTAGFKNSDATYRQTYPTWIHKWVWTSVINNQATINTSFSKFVNQWRSLRRVNEISRQDLDTQQMRGAYSAQNTQYRTRWQYQFNLALMTDHFITGTHNAKIGFEDQTYRRRFQQDGSVQQVLLSYRGGFKTPAFIDTFDAPFQSNDAVKTYTLFINDTWKLTSKLTANLGFRYDRMTPFYPQQEKAGIGPFQPKQTIPARNLGTLNGPVPRFSLIYDVFGNGKTALKASYGRYAFMTNNDDLPYAVNPMTLTTRRYAWDGTLPSVDCYLKDCPFDAAGKTPVSVTGGIDRDIDPDLKFPYTNEYTAGLDHELMTDLSLRLNVVRKFEQNRWQLYNVAIPFSSYSIPVNGVDAGRDGIAGTADDRTIALFSLEPAYVGKRKDILRNNPALDHANTTLEATVVKRFSNSWQILGGWDYLRRKVWTSANIAGDTSGIPQDPNTLRFNSGENYNTWHVKASATYEAPYGLRVSGLFRSAKGDAYGRRLSTPRMNQGVQTLYVEPIGTFFMDTVNILDFRAEKSFTVSERWGKVSAMFDLFNALNSAAVRGVNDLTGTSFQRPTQTLEPRIARLAVRYTF